MVIMSDLDCGIPHIRSSLEIGGAGEKTMSGNKRHLNKQAVKDDVFPPCRCSKEKVKNILSVK